VPLHKLSILELHLSGLNGTASHPDMKKIRLIGFFFENRLQWHLNVEKNSKSCYFRPHTYLRANKTL